MSVLAACDIWGFAGWAYTEGTFDRGTSHEAFINSILPLLNKWPGPRSICIIDNASIHRYPELEAACARVGALLIYAAPYTPHLNPIEYAFSLVKKILQKECKVAWETDVGATLDYAMREATNDLREVYKHCGFGYFGKLNFEISDVNDETSANVGGPVELERILVDCSVLT